MTTALYSHPACLRHDTGAWHPECSARLEAIEEAILHSTLASQLQRIEAPVASREALLRVHGQRHIERLEALAASGTTTAIDPDTPFMAESLHAALRAAGAAIDAVDRLFAGEIDNAFCAVRPPGHHAEPDRAMGFCLLNNIAIAAAHALTCHPAARVAIVDFDVHHGNGTEAAVVDDPRILFCSSFRHPFYPNSPLIDDHPRIIHTPLAAGATVEPLLAAIDNVWCSAIEQFSPDLILISAGFDAHRNDPLGGLQLESSDYHTITSRIVNLARSTCSGRIVSTLEGGYDLKALGESTLAHLQALL
jgi:acetoin utilization deacetylase AcuC-like enzyme